MVEEYNSLFKYFEKPRAIKTILVLAKLQSEKLDSILISIGGSKSTGMRRINELVKLGLLEKKASIEQPKRIFYLLNTKGEEIAKFLKKIGDFYIN